MAALDPFDAMIIHARETGDAQAMDSLWQATFDLPQWHFVARGEMPNLQPFIGDVEAQTYVLAFTDKERAVAFADKHQLRTKEDVVPLMSMPPEAACEYLPQFGQYGVFGVLFNEGPNGFFAPLENLEPMLEQHKPSTAE